MKKITPEEALEHLQGLGALALLPSTIRFYEEVMRGTGEVWAASNIKVLPIRFFMSEGGLLGYVLQWCDGNLPKYSWEVVLGETGLKKQGEGYEDCIGANIEEMRQWLEGR